MSDFKLTFWNPIFNHEIQVSNTYRESGYDALELHSVERDAGLCLIFEDNQFMYRFHYEQLEEENRFMEIYSVVFTPEHMRNDLIGEALVLLNKRNKKFWPFFKAEGSTLLQWCRNQMSLHLQADKSVCHHVYFTSDEVIEVIAEKAPEVQIDKK
ncbi:hypothetical protein [Alkalicoccus daliensis]|uniref:Uncharacterized protein n=1 Tax=Alkalicoccus daliensis TaxID=745820 RepID=A0A1H0CZ91_9BACI|nr:hypothetical protein [Alkalicoccus daliensis]SDN63212.1 hypothetical protein SAMN04488053_102285 [Alkalicoccus daliensis]